MTTTRKKKAAIEAVAANVMSLEDAFAGYAILPDGSTISERMKSEPKLLTEGAIIGRLLTGGVE